MDIKAAAATAEGVVEAIAKVEPMAATMASMFVPGAAPVVAMVQPQILIAIPFLERALKDIAASNGGDVMSGMIELLQHLTVGQPNSPILSTESLSGATAH